MATILEALKGVNNYPFHPRTYEEIATRRGLNPLDEATAETRGGRAYNLAVADLLMKLSEAPDVSQGGQSFSFTDEQRKQLRGRAQALYGELGEESAVARAVYGYKGGRL